MEKTIRVTGTGRILVKPDTIRLHINIKATCKEYNTTLETSTKLTESLKDVIEKLGFNRKDLKTLYYNVDTVYESYQDRNKNWKERFEGYKFKHCTKLEFKSDNELLGKVLYALAHCSAKPKIRLEYTISNPEEAKNALLGKAVKDSKEKATVLSEAAGVVLGDIQTIDYSWGEIDFTIRPMNEVLTKCIGSDSYEESTGYNMDIEADDIDVTDTVTVVWSIL